MSVSTLSESLALGVTFLFAGAWAIYQGYVFKHPAVVVLIFAGVIIGVETRSLWWAAGEELAGGNYLSMGIVVAVALYFFLAVERPLKRGDFPFEERQRMRTGRRTSTERKSYKKRRKTR